MSLAKARRKIKRAGKSAVQFRITSTFEFIELECKGSWRPEKLSVVWQRSHRKVKSNEATWTVSDDFGPNGAKGKGVFTPAIAVSLVVTLYRDASHTEFDEKEYKYYIQNDGPSGKKILASFNCNVADFVGIPSTKHALDLNFKCVSKKVGMAKLGITLESQFMKEGGAMDDDMQSTFSAISTGQESVTYDEEEEEEDEEGEEQAEGTGGQPQPSQPSQSSPRETIGSRRLGTLLEETEESAGAVVKETKKNISPSGGRRTVESIETYTPPANPYEDMGEDEEDEEAMPHPSHTEVWLEREAKLVDCFGEVVSREKLEQADLIGLYFSAGWCPPCRRFLPKLVKFYHHLKQHGKAFEILYISSDYSKQDMMKYMKEQQMPWVGICYEGSISEDFRKKYGVSAVPLFKILGRRGDTIEDSAKRSVEGATSGAAILKLYNKWHEKMMMGESNGRGGGAGGEEEVRVATASNQRKGILSKVKASIQKTPKDSEQQISDISSLSSSPPPSPESGRRVLDTRVHRKTKGRGTVSAELLEEKEERIQHLEEVNRTLKQTNDELTEELGELRQKYEAITAELEHIKSTSKTLQDESKELIANLNMRGWLYKRGVRGPTASIWRRRYFRLDQGSKLYYYKNSSEGNPQGFIDMDKVIGVQEVTASQQDKNHATFTVQCEGRTFQLQAHDEPSMRKWMEAILYMTNWRKKNSTVSVDDL